MIKYFLKIGETIKTLEKFLEIYMAIKKPSEWDENHKFCLFKEGNSPLWEQYKDGGCLILSFDKNKWSEAMNNIWELLLFAIIGDQLKTRNETISDNIVGILMNIRSKDNYLEIWLKNSKLKLETALELKYFMNVHDKQPYYFTYHRKSIKVNKIFPQFSVFLLIKFLKIGPIYEFRNGRVKVFKGKRLLLILGKD